MITFKQMMNLNKFVYGRTNYAMRNGMKVFLINSTRPGVVPIDTSKTKNTTRTQISRTSSSTTYGAIYTQTEYSKYVYFGTKKMKAGGKTGKGKWMEKQVPKVKSTIITSMKV